MNLNNPSINMKTVSTLSVLIFLVAFSFAAEAQRFSRYGSRIKRGPKTNIGFEASMGTRSFRVKSDISVINKMAVPMEGGSFGAIIGNKFYRVKLKQGFFNSADAVAQKFQMSETKGILNLYLLQSLNTRPKYFEPYFIASVDRSLLKFYGSYIDNKNTSGTSATGSQSGSGSGTGGGTSGSGSSDNGGSMSECDGPMGNPDATGSSSGTNTNTTSGQPNTPPTEPADPDPSAMSAKRLLGKTNIMYASVGMGLECHVPGKKHFVNLFAETHYGIPFSATTNVAALNNTKASAMFTVNFGLSFGISR